jgi:hypothetical protein
MPSSKAPFSYFQPDQMPTALKRAAANSYLCCPPEVLEILYAASQLSSAAGDGTTSPEDAAAAGAALIQKAQDFDIPGWANALHSISYFRNIPVQSRIHVGSAHRLAACLYTSQAIPNAGAHLGDDAGERLSRQIFEHMASVPDEDPNFKALAWPTFIAGAETKNPERRQWIMNRLRRLVFYCPWGFLYTAMEALQVIWALDSDGKGQKGWVQTLRDPELNFLIV